MTDPAHLAAVPFLAGVEPAVLTRLAAAARLADAEPGALILDGEDATTDVYLVLRGEVRVTLRTEGGKETILGDFAETALFGEMAAIDGAPRSARIAALTRARLVVLPATAFLEFVFAAPVVCHRLLRLLTARIRAQNERLLEHAALPARLRLAAELLRLARRRADGALLITPPPTGSDLAARIGVRREAVSRELAAFRRSGWVRASRGALLLAEPVALREAIDAGLRGDDA
jgi:CRP/FNR family transcriptional regulator, cyclic AMP receptor protein